MSFYIDGSQIRSGFLLAAGKLQEQKETLNRLNVFPVADRDTGVNMAMTMSKAAGRLPAAGTPSQILDEAWMNLLEFSHGNSGTILTLFFEGFAGGLPQKEQIDGRDLAIAVKKGADTAFCGVTKPMPGTILTVALQSAEAGMSMLEVTEDAGQIMGRIADEAHASLLQTPLQNPVLSPYGVVDSGALGFCLILDGFLQGMVPDRKPEPYPAFRFPDAPVPAEADLPQRYCTEFVLDLHEDTDPEILRQQIRPMGDYFLLVNRGGLCKIHIHTNEPDRVLELASWYGTLRSRKIDDMSLVSGGEDR